MPRYFLHLKDRVDAILDPEGDEMDPDAIPGAALEAARDCIAGDVKAGVLDLNYRIEVVGEDGQLVHTLRFEDALEVAPAR